MKTKTKPGYTFLKKIFVIILLCVHISISLASVRLDSTFRLKLTRSTESSPFIFTAGYRIPINKNIIINSGHGLYFEAGVNPGYLISKKLLIGLYAGWAFKDGLWATSFNNSFVDDYSTSLNEEQNSKQLDSSVINSSVGLFKSLKGRSIYMPGCSMKSFHNYSLYFGIVMTLPYKYVPIVKLYGGTTRTHYLADGNIATNDKEFNMFELRRAMYGCEVILFRGVQLNKNKSVQKTRKKNAGALSLYYEVCDFYNSSLYFNDGIQTTSIPLNKFVSQSFLQKYRKEVSWGIKLSFCIL